MQIAPHRFLIDLEGKSVRNGPGKSKTLEIHGFPGFPNIPGPRKPLRARSLTYGLRRPGIPSKPGIPGISKVLDFPGPFFIDFLSKSIRNE